MPEHLARHRLADLFLDTLPYNAHTTASDALWAGLPVVTCQGNAFAGRVGEFLCDINSAQSQSLIVVSHGILSRVLRGLYAGLPRLLALTLPIPQDRIYRLSGGNIEEIKEG